jgi:hypothetical protein
MINLSSQWFSHVGDNGRTAEPQANRHLLAGRMEGEGENAAHSGFSGGAIFPVDATPAIGIQEYTRAIRLMSQTPAAFTLRLGQGNKQWLVLRKAVRLLPLQTPDPLVLIGSQLNLVIPTAPGTPLATPLLETGYFKTHRWRITGSSSNLAGCRQSRNGIVLFQFADI